MLQIIKGPVLKGDTWMKRLLFLALVTFLTSTTALANKTPPSWLNEGPYLEKAHAHFEIPIEVIGTKIYVNVELGGKLRRMVFDTGSPSMLDSTLAKELGLKIVGKNKGLDAHGTVVETEIVQANFRIGTVDIRKVPMMTMDFSNDIATKTFVGDGLLGSDLFPLGSWQFDIKNSVLRFSSELKNLPHIYDAEVITLYQFGYPYMPIFDVRFSEHARSKALFDTGSPSYFTISEMDLAGAKKNGGIGKSLIGFGSPGRSAGGQAAATELLTVEITQLEIDKIRLGKVIASKREHPPSLIGASLLKNFIVTLDSRNKKAYFKQYSNNAYDDPSFGFSLAFNNKISIAAVWNDSPAKAAGLRAGMELTSINGEKTAFSEEGIKRVIEAMEQNEIDLEWKNGSAKLTKQMLISDE